MTCYRARVHPRLFDLTVFGRQVGLHSYGLLVAAGFAAGIWLAAREAQRRGMRVDPVLDACFWALVGGLVGSRLLFVITQADDYGRWCAGTGAPRAWTRVLWDCTRALHFWKGGIVFYGGVIGGVAGAYLAARRHCLRFLTVADLLAPALAAGHVLGRLGCYAAGCCFGKPTISGWGAQFPSESLAAGELLSAGVMAAARERTPALHPTQLYEAAAVLALLLGLSAWRRRKRADGQVFALYLCAYAVLRALLEVFRGDAEREFAAEVHTPALSRALDLDPALPTFLSTSQFISALLLAAGAALWWWVSRGARTAPAAS